MAPTAVSSGVRVAREKGASDASNYTHTHVAVYTVALATLGVIFTDSTRVGLPSVISAVSAAPAPAPSLSRLLSCSFKLAPELTRHPPAM